MSEKFPAWQFYPGDWKKDMGVQSLNYEEQGIWFNLLLFMFESEERGKLILNGVPMSVQDIADLLKLDLAKTQQTLSKLLSKGVAKKEGDGPIYNKRMVDDDRIRKIRAQSGAEGGKQKASKILANGKQKSTPSVSSSASASAAAPFPVPGKVTAGGAGSSPAGQPDAPPNTPKNECKPALFEKGVLGDGKAPESSIGAKAGAVLDVLKPGQDGKTPLQYPVKPYMVTQPLQKVVCCWKEITGYEFNDRGWDKLNWPRTAKAAKVLLDFFGGNWERTSDCMEDIYKQFTGNGLTVTVETIVKHAAEWNLKKKKDDNSWQREKLKSSTQETF